jgi:hypothetical protein
MTHFRVMAVVCYCLNGGGPFGIVVMSKGLFPLMVVLALALSAEAQIKAGEWNGFKQDGETPGLFITLYESGDADFFYTSLDAEIMATGTWTRMKEGKFVGDALLNLTIEYIKKDGRIYGQGKPVVPIYFGQAGSEAWVIKGVAIEGIEIDISFPLKHTGHRHIRKTEGNH